MPAFDKTGPLGKGSLTGKGLGKCVVSEEEFNKNWAKRFKFPFGFGRGPDGKTGKHRGMFGRLPRW